MTNARPELVVVTGPQKGGRAFLTKNIITIGRVAPADICILEQFVSRQQAKLTFTNEGWVIENLAKNNNFAVNGKTYKPGQKIIIETADLITIGKESNLIFVDKGFDSGPIIEDYYRRCPLPEPVPVPVPEPEPENKLADPTKLSEQDLSQMLADQPSKLIDIDSQGNPLNSMSEHVENPQEPDEPEIDEEALRKAKRKKYLVGFGIYAIILVALIAFFSTLKGKNSSPSDFDETKRVELTDRQITKLLTAKLRRAQSASRARQALSKANEYEMKIKADPTYPYLSMLNYRLFKAYAANTEELINRNLDEKKIEHAREVLLDTVINEYHNMINAQRSGEKWYEAKEAVEKLVKMLPMKTVDDNNDYTVRKFLDNIDKHYNYICRQIRLQKKRRR